MTNKDYGAESIKVLGDIQHIQQRSGMYIGDAIDPRQLLSEIIDNAIDEVQAGFSDEFIVSVNSSTNEYTVRDFGRGIPHGKKLMEDGTEKEVLEVLLTKSHSGGKFDNTSYKYSAGLNGLGLTITNALSKYIIITSYRDGSYVKATANASSDVKLEFSKSTERRGTEVVFCPDPIYFHSAVIPQEFILEKCRVATALGFRGRLFVDDVEIPTNASIYDLIKEEKVSTYLQVSPIEVMSEEGERMKVAMKYTSETNDRYFGYTNLLSNTMGGTHVTELSKTVVASWKEFLDENKAVKPSIELHPTDYLVGLRAVCAVFISKPEFSSQTKEKLVNNKKYFEPLMELFKKQFKKFLKQNIDIAHQLIKRFEEYRLAQNSLLARREISSLIKVNTDSDDNIRRRSVVSKLIECTSKKRKGSELFLCEGDSASGPYKFVRNPELQAILPLRGKVLNVTYKSVKDAVKNNEICDIANSIGCGIGSACDPTKSRYEKIIISADADPDGAQISCLILSVFVNLFPELVKAGMVYVTIPPLWCWGKDEKTFGWCSDVKDIPTNVKDAVHFKGLGEMENSQLYHFLVNPKTRNIMQVEYPSDIDRFNKILGTSTGKNELMKELGLIV